MPRTVERRFLPARIPMLPAFSICRVYLMVATALMLSVRAGDGTVVFNEVMYHPATPAAAEWIEFKNVLSVNVDISGWQVTGGVNFTFAEGSVVPAGGFLVASSAAGNPANALGPWTGSLANEGEAVRLRNRNGGIVDELEYGDSGEWPIGADGSGMTLAKRRGETASAAPGSWLVSAQTGGTPGAENFPTAPPARTLVFNELAATGAGFFIELRNVSASPVELGGIVIASPDIGGNYVLPAGSLAPGELRVIDAATLGFNPPAEAKLFLFAPDRTALLDAQRMRITGRARSEEGAEWLVPTGSTPGAMNSFALRNDVVISEIHYHPRSVPANPGSYADSTFANLGDSWRYEASDTDLGTAWRQPGYDDGAWSTGTSPFEGAGGQGYTQTVQAAGPVAYWRLGENPATGTAFDSSAIGGAQDGTYANAAARAGLISGDANGAVTFSGATQVSGSGFTGVFNNDWTIEAWFIHTAQAQWSGIFSNNGASGDVGAPLMTFIEDSTRVGINGAGVTPANISVELSPNHYGKTVYAAITKSGGNAPGTNTITVRAWIDGVEVPSATGSSTWTLNPRPTWLIGRHWMGDSQFHRGAIDEVAVYTRALSAEEVADHARRGRLGAGTSLPTGVTTTYFRKAFNFSGNAAQTALSLRTLIDDGAVFYLNGVEIARQNMPGGAVSHNTLAAAAVGVPLLGDRVLLPSTGLLQGANVLAVELHQASAGDSDASFGMELTARETLAPPTPRRELETEFVEVHNRSGASIDLGGWALAGDVGFAFEAGTTLPAGGFLAVARDPAALQARHPGALLAGPFDGQLSNSGGRIVLRDPITNPADVVAFLDGRPWPEAADGGGATLELLDPDADNNAPQAWAGSDEFARTAWQTYTYRGVADASAIGPDGAWREFALGMIDEGEVLLDDVQVIEDPEGARVAMLQNSNFSGGLASWRVLGNHTGSVIPEPGAPGNQVLRLVATGATDHDGNLVETTLAGGRSVVNGRTYEISFRARWLSGSQFLNTRLYFNRLSRTTRLAAPEAAGTPGAPNSRGFGNIGPTFSGLRHAPAVPAAGAPVTVTVRAADPDGVGPGTLHYSVNGGTWQSTTMTSVAGTFSASIPGQAASAMVQFYVEAADGLGVFASAPAAGPASRALYKVQDGLANPALHNVRLIMTSADANALHANANLMSSGERGATVIFDESEIFYDAGVHLRGSRYGRPYNEFVSFSVSFPADQLFRGVHRRIVLDRSGRGLFGTPSPDEIFVKHMAGHAGGGLAELRDDIVRVMTPLPQHTSVALLTTDYSNDWLDRHFDGGSDSPLYKFDGIYYANRTTDGNAESPKVAEFGPIVYGDFTSYGSAPENYRWTFVQDNASDQIDATRLMALGAALDLSGAALDAASRAVMDVDQWARTFALQSLVGNGDFYTHSQPHNLKIYLRPEDDRFVAFQHDSDVLFQRPADASLIGTTGNLVKVFNLPANRRLFHGHLLDLINTTFNPTYMAPWVSHYGAKAGKDFSAALNYISQRRTYVLGQLPAAVPFAMTSNGGADFTVNTGQTTLEGTGWIDVREIRRADTGAVLATEWISENTWRVSVGLVAGPNAITLRAFNAQGAAVGSDSITITSTVSAPRPGDFLRITELHYHPAEPTGAEIEVSTAKDDFEFLELRNIGTDGLDVSNCYFDEGISFTFPSGTVIAAGESVVLVRHVAAFRARYGSAPRVIGSYAPASLDNGGETLTLRDVTGAIIQSFTWDDAWLTATDGEGYSLMVRNQGAPVADWNSPGQWGIHPSLGGSPGSGNGTVFAWQFDAWRRTHFTPTELENPLVSGASASPAGDGTSNLLRYAFALTPFEPVGDVLRATEVNGQFAVTHRRRQHLLDVRFAVEVSTDLRTWREVPDPVVTTGNAEPGVEIVTVRENLPRAGQTPFVRLRVTLR